MLLQVNTSHIVKCEAETVDLVLFAFVEGPRVGWILAAKHPVAVSTNPLPAFQRGHSHTASGEGCPHSSCLINTHSGRDTFLLNSISFAISKLNMYSVLSVGFFFKV